MQGLTTLKAKQVTKAYDWLLRSFANNSNKWYDNEVLWITYIELFPTSALSRQEFDELIRQMKEEEGWV